MRYVLQHKSVTTTLMSINNVLNHIRQVKNAAAFLWQEWYSLLRTDAELLLVKMMQNY